MPYVNKLVSCRSIIAKIKRDFKPSNSSWVNEAIEDIGWAIQGIGYHVGFVDKSSEYPYIEVKNNRALIPCEFERVKHVEWMIPVNNTGNILNPDGTTPFPQEDSEENICNFKGIRLRLGSDSTMSAVDDRHPRTTHVIPADAYYTIDGDYIKTSFESGRIKIHGPGFPTDKDGLPKIIDDFDYKTAVEWYVIQAMLLKGYKHPELSWKEAWRMWDGIPEQGLPGYRHKAENAPKMQSLDGAERFRNTWNRFANGINFGEDFYMHLETPEFITR